MAGDGQRVASELAEYYAAAELVGLVLVVVEVEVDAPELARALVVPAARAVDEARGIYVRDGVGERVGVELAPALVEYDPHDDARVVIEVRDHVQQLLAELLAAALLLARELHVLVVAAVRAGQQGGADGERGIAPAAVRHILPDEHPQAVAVIVPAVGLDLHVLAQGVEAHRLGRGDVEYERGVAGRGVEPVGPPALVEEAVHEIGLPVEQQALHAVPVLADGDAAQGEIALRAVLAEREDELIEIGVLRRPEADVAELYERALPGGELELLAVNLRAHRALAADVELDLAALGMRRDEEAGHVVLRHALAPDGLPYPAHGAVPYAAGLELLLAARVPGAVRGVRDADDEGVCALRQKLGYVRREGEGAARVRADVLAVEPDARALVDRAEVQQYAAYVEALRQLEFAPVPQEFARLQHPLHAREDALRREGDAYLEIVLLGLAVLAGEGAVPEAV